MQVAPTLAILHKTTNPNSQFCMSGSAFLYSAPLLRTPEDYRKLSHSVDIVSVGVLMTVGAQCAQSTEQAFQFLLLQRCLYTVRQSVLFKFSYVSTWGTLYKATTPGDARIAIRLKGHAGVACAGKPHS